MQWSQLKKRVESLFAVAVKGRVELRTTQYHNAPDLMGRGWITSDGREAANMCSFTHLVSLGREAQRLRKASGCEDYQDPQQCEGYYQAYDQAQATIRAKGVFARYEFHHALLAYLDMSMNAILASPNPLIRAIGMLDRRFGKRRLALMDSAKEHPLVQQLLRFRCEAEGFMK